MASHDITIPDELKPADGRFGSGPSKVPDTAMAALSASGHDIMGTSHRKPAVKGQVKRLQEGLAEFFSLPDGYEVVLGVGGTTAFWDVVSYGLVREQAQAAAFGEFGNKFVKAVSAPHLRAPSVREGEPGNAAYLEAEAGVDVYGTTHNETSTGVAVPVQRVPDGDALTIHDATSAVAGLPVDMNETDCYYFAPQKGLASDGGLWIAVMSPAALERTAEIKASSRYIPAFLDLQTAVDNSRKNQTYNTPAVATLILAAEQIDRLNATGGLEQAVKRCATSAETIYSWAEASRVAQPYVTDPDLRSSVVTTVDFDGVDAADIAQVLRNNGIVDTEPYRKLGRNQLRIATYPAVDPADVSRLTGAVDYVVERLAA
ncbi:phosphoserine transaminase [Haloglycomyces albus]|uniref:phosphoserine transaminase n=1 Tax=Haloglycomyces albus TaxID=526067 RepID=UPI00046D96B9|nr:phosphoserine transaminase [Haloglycomyces albus]